MLTIVGMVARLFFVQIIQHGAYLAAAADQHQFYAELAPSRGKILLRDQNGSEYSLAANKEFVVIYAVPSEIKQAEEISQKLYEFFKQNIIEKEVDEFLKKEAADSLSQALAVVRDWAPAERAAQEAVIKAEHEAWLSDPLYLESWTVKRQAMIEEKKQAAIGEYKKILNKKNDPYEVLEKKVEPALAKQFHWALLSDSGQVGALTMEDLAISNGQVLDKKSGHNLKIDGLGYALESYRYYPENAVAAHLLGFTSFDQSERYGQIGKHGNYGLEGFFDEELFGKIGSVKSEKGAGGLVIAQGREYVDKQDGCDLILTIDRSVQFYIDKVLRQGFEKYQADNVNIIVLDPRSGAVLGMSSVPNFNPNLYNENKNTNVFNNQIIFNQYEPGSVFKAITLAAALDRGMVNPDTSYQDAGQIMIEGWPKPIKNSDFDTVGGHGTMNMVQVLEKSLNTGAIFAMKSIGPAVFAGYVKNFGFGEKTGIELEGESTGDITELLAKNIKPVAAATASFGQGISVTPLQMAVAYGALANGGQLMKPYVVKQINCPNGEIINSEPHVLRQVISREAAELISGMLVKVVENGHARLAQVDGYYIAGKTGTAQVAESGKKGYVVGRYNHTFVGYGPVPNPQFVVLVELSNPKGFEYAESTAVPLAREVIEFLLNYMQIPKSR